MRNTDYSVGLIFGPPCTISSNQRLQYSQHPTIAPGDGGRAVYSFTVKNDRKLLVARGTLQLYSYIKPTTPRATCPHSHKSNNCGFDISPQYRPTYRNTMIILLGKPHFFYQQDSQSKFHIQHQD